jgi:hypothetical protein
MKKKLLQFLNWIGDAFGYSEIHYIEEQEAKKNEEEGK